MSDLGRFQAAVAEALLAASGDAAPADFDAAARRRFRVYRNNVHHGLSEALGVAYPCVRRLVGDAFFQATARAFITANPPRTRSLALFGDGFAAFLESFPPAAALPYLPDIARLERAILEALHACDATPLTPEAACRLETMLDDHARFEPHPATRLIVADHPVVSLWRADRTGGTRVAGRPETALVTRPHDRVRVACLSPAQGVFARHVLLGEPASVAFAEATRLDPAFDAVAGWRHLLAAGALLFVDTATA